MEEQPINQRFSLLRPQQSKAALLAAIKKLHEAGADKEELGLMSIAQMLKPFESDNPNIVIIQGYIVADPHSFRFKDGREAVSIQIRHFFFDERGNNHKQEDDADIGDTVRQNTSPIEVVCKDQAGDIARALHKRDLVKVAGYLKTQSKDYALPDNVSGVPIWHKHVRLLIEGCNLELVHESVNSIGRAAMIQKETDRQK